MRAELNSRAIEPLAYLTGFAAAALPGTMFLLSSEVQVAGWKLAILDIAELTAGEAMRSGFLHRVARGRNDERR